MKLFLIKLGLFHDAEEIKNIMYESFKEILLLLITKLLYLLKATFCLIKLILMV